MKLPAALSRYSDQIQRCCKGLYGFFKESPMVFGVIIVVLVLLVLLGTLFHKMFSLLAGSRGAIFLDVALLWLLIRDVSRLLLFPGSFFLYQRNLEATFRVDIARQYCQHLKQLHLFLCHVSKHTVGVPSALTAENVLRGYTVVECIARSFQMQQNDKVRLSTEQVEMLAMTSAMEKWLRETKIQRRVEGSAGDLQSVNNARPLVEWLREETSNMRSVFGFHSPPMPLSLKGIELVDVGHEASCQINRVDQLLTMLNDLRNEKANYWAGALRFLRVPTIGSLDQLRAELQMRYHGVHCWVTTKRGNKLDGMFIPCNPDANGVDPHDADVGEGVPLNNLGAGQVFSGPTVVWCNPNAAYYEPMVYQTTMLNFYLERGCNLFLFNWTGYGRSTGYVHPNAIPEDGEAVVEFLKSKGITEIGIHGRSIGNLASCHLARKYPEVVKFLVADRTFSKLKLVAKSTYGVWAHHGLLLAQLPRTINANWASITPHFVEAKCHKVMVCDPKDAIIPDLAALRTEVAHQALAQMSKEEKLVVEDEQFYRLLEVWRFFISFFGEHEDEEDTFGIETRNARQPPLTATNDYVRVKVADSSVETSPAQKKNGAASNAEKIDVRWLQDHMSSVRSAIGAQSDQVRLALDVVIECLDAGGLNLHDVLGELPDNPCPAMKAWLENIQVWGSIGNPRDASSSFASTTSSSQAGVSEFEIEGFLRKSDAAYISHRQQVGRKRIDELLLTLSPDALADYHRQMARSQIIYVRGEFRRRLAALQQAFRNDSSQGTESERIREVVLGLLGEVESFITRIARFFKSVDLMLPDNSAIGRSAESLGSEGCSLSDSSDEKTDGLGRSSQSRNQNGDRTEGITPRPIIDHGVCGHVIHTDCGHNGVLDDSEFRLIALHMRVACFGRQPGEVH